MADELDAFKEPLNRLRDLLARGAMDAFLRNPIITPHPTWFPDRWSSDAVSVRHLLLRIADYCGMHDLGVEVELGDYSSSSPTPRFTGLLGRQHSESGGAAGLYFGTENGTAYFGVDRDSLDDPDLLIGVLAHEMTHAWRDRHSLVEEDRGLEEELTDITSVALGFGIFAANATYRVTHSGAVRGAMASTGSRHRTAGYLPVEVVTHLLAAQLLVRGERLDEVRRHLGTTQKAIFDAAAEHLDRTTLSSWLGLPDPAAWPPKRMASSTPRAFPLSWTERAVHAEVKQLVTSIGENGGLLPAPRAVEFDPDLGRSRTLASWGRATSTGGWSRSLVLVEDPEWDTRAVLLLSDDESAPPVQSIGHLREKVCRRRSSLRDALSALFRRDGPLAPWLAPQVPGCVLITAAELLGERELHVLFDELLKRFDRAHLDLETRHLDRFEALVIRRVEHEAGSPDPPPQLPPSWVRAPRSWWDVATEPQRREMEWTTIGRRFKGLPASESN